MRNSKRNSKRNANNATDSTVTAVAPVAPVAPVTNYGGFSIGNITRTANVAHDMRYPFNQSSSRDDAYAAFFALACAEHGTGDGKRTVTLAALASYGKNPLYTGSAKPHDAGAIERQAKRGFITFDRDARTITFTDTGIEAAVASLNRMRKAGTLTSDPRTVPDLAPAPALPAPDSDANSAS